ncbi:MAG: hypothetical protein ABI672_05915 [Vicinamibacteria bacterium]
MNVVVVEDDPIQNDEIAAALRERFKGVRVLQIGTESEFQQEFLRLTESPPDFVVMDVMLRWTRPIPDAPPMPANVRAERFITAGVRCCRMLLGDAKTADIPVLLYSVLERGDVEAELAQMPSHVRFMTKGVDDRLMLRHVGSHAEGRHEKAQAGGLWNNIEAKPGFGGFKVDLKALLSGRGGARPS